MGREKLFISVVIFITGVFLFFSFGLAQGKVLFSQISAENSTASDEFVELYNYSDSIIPLSEYKLKKIASTGSESYLVSDFGSATINPFSYFLVAHDDYSNIEEIVADIYYTNKSNSLARNNNGVALFNNFGEIIDIVIWGEVSSTVYCCGYSLSEIEKNKSAVRLPDNDEGNGQDSDNCLNDFLIFDSFVPKNSQSLSRPYFDPPTTTPPIDPPTSTPPIDPPTTTPTTTPPIDPPTSTPPIDPPTTTPTSSPVIDWAMIKINEFVSNPMAGNEWVELYNLSENDVNLSGSQICDNRETGCKSIAGIILANSWYYFDLLSSSFLNNDGDSVILKDLESNIIERIDYDSSRAPEKGESLARSIDGLGDFALTTQMTPGETNVIVPPVVVGSGGGGVQAPAQTDQISAESIICEEINIFINELYPNPPGSDAEEEFVEIINLTSSTINLDGWKLTDSVQSFVLSGVLNPNQILFWKRAETKIALNNTAPETVKLIDVNKCEIDVVSYDKAGEGESYARALNGDYFWTSSPSPGENNIFSQKDSGIVWKIRYPAHGVAGDIITFDAEDSADEKGGEISFEWDFGNATSSGAIASKVFSIPGDYQIKVSASSTSGSKGTKLLDLTISALASSDPSDILISEIFANPFGSDTKEFIEIFNSGEKEMDLTGWVLRANSGAPFVFSTGTKIGANKYLVFFKTATKISINNTEDKISLTDNNKRLVDMIRIGKSNTDESYALADGEWEWMIPSPGELNTAILSLANPASVANKKITAYPLVAIEIARQMEKDDGVKTRGVVVVLPQMFGKQYFYIFDGTSGIQIYQYRGKFPVLKFGDLVEVRGILSEASGVKRIKLKNENDVDVLAIENNLPSISVPIDELNEEYLGALVKVEGEITSKKTNFIYVDDGQGEIKIYFKQNAKIDKSVLEEGGHVSVVGILEINAGEITILPRLPEDVIAILNNEIILPVKDEKEIKENGAKKTAEKYLTATAGGLTALILGFLSRARGMAIIGLLKKIATKFITRV